MIMDYEKAYKDIVSKITQIYNYPKSAVKEGTYFNGYVESGIRDAMEALIPFESEDETFARIVLDLPFKHEADYKFVRAYLEKQKEQTGKKWIYEDDYKAQLDAEYQQGLEDGRKEQKPAEWSEEDEKIRQSLINDLENAETEDEDVQRELNEKVAWLKSLRPRPHWKPSEEQMEALETGIENTQHLAATHFLLVSLYDDLKKL